MRLVLHPTQVSSDARHAEEHELHANLNTKCFFVFNDNDVVDDDGDKC